MKLTTIKSVIIGSAMLGLVLFSCNDDTTPDPKPNTNNNNTSEYTHFSVKLTDAPGDYEEVNIDIQKVRVQLSDSSWKDLTTNAGIYDLLTLRNGVDTTIVNDSLTKGVYITGMRLVLGDSNNVYVDSAYYALKVPSGTTSGYKINFSDSLAADSLNIILDFDAEKSIVQQGQGHDYLLKPVVKVK